MKKYYYLLTLLMFLAMSTFGQLPGYNFFKVITIQNTMVAGPGPHIDFPVLISHTDPDLRTTGNGGNVENINGFDIRFTAANGTTVLDHQIEDYNPTTGEIIAWVRVPSVSATVDTDIHIYYGNSAIVVDPSTETTWDTNYQAVYHFLNSSDLEDNTTNTNNLISNGTSKKGGLYDKCHSYKNPSEYDQAAPDPSLLIVGDVTLETWVDLKTLQVGTDENVLFSHSAPGETSITNYAYMLTINADGRLRFFHEHGAGINEEWFSTISSGISTGTWNHIAVTRDVSANLIYFYFNGVQLGAPVAYGSDPDGGGNGWLQLAADQNPTTVDLDADLDEVRISDVLRSSEWIQTSYNSMSNTLGSFYTMSAQMMPPPPTWCWAEDALAGGNEEFLDLATEPTTGLSYAVGYFNGDLSAEFPMGVNGTPDMSTTLGNEDGLVVKYDAQGNALWAFKIGSSGSTVQVHSIALDASGDIYITGEFDGTNVEFQGVTTSSLINLTSSGGSDVFIAKYNSNGELQWVDQGIGSSNDDIGHSIAASANGIYVCGEFGQTMNFDAVTLTHYGGGNDDAFVVKYDFAGNAQWGQVAGSNSGAGFRNERAFGITSDGSDVFVTGIFFENINFPGPTTLNNFNGSGNIRDIWVASYNEISGNFQWVQQIGSAAGEQANDIAVDNVGVYLTGGLDDNGGTVTFPGLAGTTTGNNGEDIFTCRLNKTTGNADWVWVEENNSSTDVRGQNIVADASGNITVTGEFIGTTQFGAGTNPITSGGGSDMFVMQRTNAGAYLWTQMATDNNDLIGNGLGYDNLGGVYVAGMMDNQANFGAQPVLGNAGGDDAFIAKINCTTPSCGPTITVCQNDTTVLADPTCNYTLPDLTSAVVYTDGCGLGILSVKQTPAIGTVLPAGEHIILITVTDINNNIDTCSFKLTISADINPIIVACGDILLGETTIGDTNNANSFSCVGFNTPGEDRYYQITVPSGNFWLQISIDNVVDANDTWVETFWVGGNCPLGGSCIDDDYYDIASQQFSGGGNSIQYLAVGPGTYYFVVDSRNDGIDSYDIRFDCLDSGIEFDTSATCGDPNNDGVVPYLNGSSVNLATQTCDKDTFCHELYIANRQDAEWVDSVYMNLGSCYENVVPANLPGVYQPGTWVSTYNATNNTISWQFNNTNVAAWGDGYGSEYACDSAKTHMFEFCFTADISTTCVSDSNLNVGIFVYDDAIAGGGNSVAGFDYELSEDFTINNPAPTITCPSNVTANNDVGNCSAQVIGIGPTASGDNCPNPIITFNLTGATTGSGVNDASGTTFNVGVTTVQYMITDSAGLKDSCQFTVTVNDIETPSLTCPGNVTISTGVNSCDTVVNGIGLLASGDNCAIDSISYKISGATSVSSGLNDASGTSFNVGVSTVHYMVTDSSGNIDTCSFTVTVNDNINPTLSCPNNVSIQCPGVVNSIAPISPNDNCAIDSVSYVLTGATTGSGLNDASGTFFNQGVTTVTYTVTDSSGNTATCNFTVTVNDAINPTLSCPNNVTISCPAVVNSITPINPNDNCAIDSVNYVLTGATTGSGLNDASGTFFNQGVTTVTYTITDSSGNTTSCNFTVTVNDNINPTITCPANVSVVCPSVVNSIAPVATNDNCAIDSVNYILTGATTGSGLNDASGTFFNQGVTTVTYTVTDSSGNTTSCNFTVTVNDNINPTITCPGNISASTSINSCDTIINGIAPLTINDNCAIDSVNYVLTGATTGSGLNDASGTLFNQGVTTVTYTVTDSSGNTANCNFTVTVNDNINPIITCPGNISASTSINSCDTIINGIAPLTINDNCAIDSVNYVLTGVTTSSGSTDASGETFNLGLTNVVYYIYDLAGNIDSCSFTVNVIDSIPPTISCPGNISASTSINSCDTIINGIAPLTINDNCAIDSVSFVLTGATTGSGLNDASGETFNLGITNVKYYIYDLAGNVDSCSFAVNVIDSVAPSITCPGNISLGSSTNSCDTIVNGIAPISTNDNCAIDSVNYVLTGVTAGSGTTDASGETFNVGLTNVKYYIYDLVGNVDSCSFSVTVIDSIPPSISCPGNISLSTSINSCDTIVNGIAPTLINDNCAIDSVSFVLTGATTGSGLNDASGETFNSGTTTVKYYIYDLAGNIDSCSFIVNVIDSIPPTISCPGNISASTSINSCDTIINGIAPLTINDNCAIDSVSFVLTGATTGSGLNDASGTLFNQGVTTVAYTVTDSSGNTTNCNFTVTVIDSIPPTITCPGNIVICDTNVTVPIPIFSDNCMINTVTNDFNGLNNASGVYPYGITTVNWTATDTSGNSSNCSMTIEVEVPPFSDAGPDQKLVGVNTTSLDGSTPINGIGTWLNITGYGFIQSVNNPKSILEDLDPGINVFEWIVSHGTCLDSTDEVEIEYIPLKIPNGFSPNNDGDNDQFVITGIDLIENELVIFNRWGVELYNQYNYQNDWEGKSKDGKELPEDTYFYILKIPELEKEFSGYIVLKR